MPLGEYEPMSGGSPRTDPDDPGEGRPSIPDPGDDYFSSGSFSPVTVQLEDDKDIAESDGPAPADRRASDAGADDSPQVIAQLGEDPGALSREDPDDA